MWSPPAKNRGGRALGLTRAPRWCHPMMLALANRDRTCSAGRGARIGRESSAESRRAWAGAVVARFVSMNPRDGNAFERCTTLLQLPLMACSLLVMGSICGCILFDWEYEEAP